MNSECVIPSRDTHVSSKIQNLRESSFNVRGPRLFNKMPACIRNMSYCKIDKFKSELDNHLKTLPDTPLVQGYQKYCARVSNSLLDL